MDEKWHELLIWIQSKKEEMYTRIDRQGAISMSKYILNIAVDHMTSYTCTDSQFEEEFALVLAKYNFSLENVKTFSAMLDIIEKALLCLQELEKSFAQTK